MGGKEECGEREEVKDNEVKMMRRIGRSIEKEKNKKAKEFVKKRNKKK